MTTLIPSLFFVLVSFAKGDLLYPENGAELNHIQVLFELR
ncbi:uncharacterized protein METZ01_LOCUS124697 [marine metagenome]|jgi:hypothetical protein|uniref:Uncharacterized protein n=1 Tax=marine metagenome TaxID=408172 RepID=A0A381Y5S5_9ZZZZ